MNCTHKYLFALLILGLSIHAQDLADRYPIIPKPISIIPAPGTFTINPSTRIVTNSPQAADYIYNKYNNYNPNLSAGSLEKKDLISYAADFFTPLFGTPLKMGKVGIIPSSNTISILITEQGFENPETYELTITHDNIIIMAQTLSGAFYGFQTLRQLMPASIHKNMPLAGQTIQVPCVTIKDAPRFQYRGLHLDVSRHFFPTSFIKKYIDLMAFYKLNTFHWHLTDDQGWRIEIKKYPKLQEVAAWRKQTLIGHNAMLPHTFEGTSYGGYYTQDEIKDIVEYARVRHITILPEIDMPGHSMAALAAYPELGCTQGPYETSTTWGIHHDIYCAGNEKTFIFLQDVLTEVIDLFPSTYIHIGGDEAPKSRWKECSKCQALITKENLQGEDQLQNYFVTRIEKFLNAHGRQIIGWDEILEGGLAPHATVMSWRGIQGGIEAATLNHDVIMTPNQFLYFDYYQSQSPYEPLAIGHYLPLEKVYTYEPVPHELTEQQAKHILGAQANVWTEYMATPEHVEYMVFPRLAALAELAWSTKSQKNYDDFCVRLKKHENHLRAMSVHYADW